MNEPTVLDKILEPGALCALFQPAMDVSRETWQVHFIECLTLGPHGSNVETADVLFEYVRRKREEVRVDRACVANSLRCASEAGHDAPFAINVHACTIGRDHEFVVFLERVAASCNFSLQRLIVEIVEPAPHWQGNRFCEALYEMRRLGIRLAVHDLAIGKASLVLACRPDYIKVDRHLVAGCSRHHQQRALLRCIVDLAEQFSSRVVGVGPEGAEDIRVLRELGIELVQGDHIRPPTRSINASIWIEDNPRPTSAGTRTGRAHSSGVARNVT